MKVSLIQMDIVWLDAAANRMAAERLMRSAEKSDIYVLPEMWNTGVTTEPQGILEIKNEKLKSKNEEGSQTLLWMQAMADELDAAVAGSVAVHLQDGTYRNRLYFVTPQTPSNSPSKGRNQESLPKEGEVWKGSFYDKHHLFSYGGETENYTPGNERVTVEWRGVRFRLSVCYDLRFPLWLRNKDDYDVLICVASWPTVRTHAWQVLLQARAIENQCYVLGVNRIGKDPVCEYSGSTCVVDPFGFATFCPEGEASVVTQTLDLKRLKAFREKFPVLKEAD